MRTIAETFLALSDVFARARRGAGTDAGPDPIGLCDETRDAYLAQPDLPAFDAEFTPQLFAGFRALLPPPRSAALIEAKPVLHVDDTVSGRRSAPVIAATLAAVLVGSIAIGTLTLSIVLTVALGLLAYVAAGGRAFGLSPNGWPFGAPRVAARNSRAIAGAGRPPRGLEIDRLEDAFRHTDVLLARLREVQPVEPPAAVTTLLDEPHLQFIQDLAEAASASDGDHLIRLASRRLPTILQARGLRLATLADGEASCFVIDQVADQARGGTSVTVRPAIMCGDQCLSRGYAQRYV